MNNEFRLGCTYCDRADFDGIPSLAIAEMAGWEEVGPFDSSVSVFDWETHMGVCPDCAPKHCRVPSERQ